MRYFADYALDPASAGADDSPLYIFDGTFGDRDESKALLADYRKPGYFNEDLFQHVGEDRRPPYRWVVFGPARTGSSLHIDPLATSAWNALLQGRKRWCLLPPGIPRSDVRPRGVGLDSEAVRTCALRLRLRSSDLWLLSLPRAAPALRCGCAVALQLRSRRALSPESRDARPCGTAGDVVLEDAAGDPRAHCEGRLAARAPDRVHPGALDAAAIPPHRRILPRRHACRCPA